MCVCETYGMSNGCDERCPALLEGDCDIVDEVIDHLKYGVRLGYIDENKYKKIIKLYTNTIIMTDNGCKLIKDTESTCKSIW